MIEATRFEVESDLLEGRWLLPDRPPPLPLVIVPSLVAGLDWTGASTRNPGFRPWWMMGLALQKAGVAAFLSQAPEGADRVGAASEAAWFRATNHHLVSRSRRALLAAGGDACERLLGLVASLGAHQQPMGLILVAPELPLEVPETAADLRLHILATGSEDDPAGEAARLRSRGYAVTAERLAGLDPDLCDARIPQTPVRMPHRRLGSAVAGIALMLLRPRWEQAVRPAGTAIG